MLDRLVLDRLSCWWYQRLGRHYWLVLVAGQAGVSIMVVLLTLGGIGLFLQPTRDQDVALAAAGVGLTVLATGLANLRALPAYNLVVAWHDKPDPTPGETVAAWRAATTVLLSTYRRSSAWVNLGVIVPLLVLAYVMLGLDRLGVVAIALATIAPAVWATFLSYSTGEFLARPVVADIAAALPDEFPFARSGLPISLRMRIGLPAYTVVSGLGAAALVSGNRGADGLLVSVLVAAGVGGLMAAELSVILTRAIGQPIQDLRVGVARVQTGDYSARVPVLSSDEIGALSHDFNRMARGLEERERMRAAFGTYVDKAVVEVILQGDFPADGLEVDLSVLFCDVRGFTSYAESATAREVIAVLNRLFEVLVPIVEEHGGHVDKFIGDGLMAVFGAPDFHVDHADRAAAAACEMVAAARAASLPLSVGCGVNSGVVVAGALGGAGRLNFSVIGDVVNVAARVEAATRQTGDDVLVTAETRRRLTDVDRLVSRGTIPLKGKSEPVELFAYQG